MQGRRCIFKTFEAEKLNTYDKSLKCVKARLTLKKVFLSQKFKDDITRLSNVLVLCCCLPLHPAYVL